jgi:hypothetical protein
MLRHAVLALAIVLAALSGAQVAEAQGVGRGLVPMPPITHPGTHPPGGFRPAHHPIKRYPFWGYGGYAPSLFYAPYASPEPTVVYQPIVVYSQPSEFAPSPSMELGLPPMPSVIPYPDGRYVLMGDGINSAYRWVWIPNPPSAPPEKSPPAVAPGPAAARAGVLYRWVDDQDVVHYTQGWDAVPERYRSQVKLAGTR